MEIDSQKEDLFLKNIVFQNDSEFYEKLQKLHKQKLEVKQMHDMCKLSKPFVIEFCGTPRTYRTFTINNLYDFLEKEVSQLLLLRNLLLQNIIKRF